MDKKVSAIAIHALKEALCNIYWYKSDLRSFLTSCIQDPSVLNVADWDNYKRQIVSDVIDQLCADQERYLGDIRRLFHELLSDLHLTSLFRKIRLSPIIPSHTHL